MTKSDKELAEQMYEFNVIHGQYLVGQSLNHLDILSKSVEISEDLQIVCVTDENSRSYLQYKKIIGRPIHWQNKYEKYIKWSTKIIGLYDYLKDNYSTIPKYLMYLDSYDTMLIKDMPNPKEMLDYYQCQVLFNCENAFGGHGYPHPERYPEYWQTHGKHFKSYSELLEKKYGNVGPQPGLNAGVFLGEKEFMLEMITTVYEYLIGNPKNGFPYGTGADQELFRYFQIQNFDKVGLDIFNKYFFWGCPGYLNPGPEDRFGIEYFRVNYKNYYESRNNN